MSEEQSTALTEFIALAEELSTSVIRTLKIAHSEYANDVEDVFKNFNIASERVGISREKVWLVLAHKHFEGISNHIRGVTEQREPLRGRIVDLMAYLILLYGMSVEPGEASEASGPWP